MVFGGGQSPVRHLLLIGSGLLTLALVAKGLLTESGVRRHAVLQAQLLSLRAEFSSVQAKNRRLRAQVEALKTDPDYVDWVIRQELGWVRADERVVVLRR